MQSKTAKNDYDLFVKNTTKNAKENSMNSNNKHWLYKGIENKKKRKDGDV
jgi:hypothetical protein